MIKLGIIVIASSTMALSSAVMQDDKDIISPVQITEPKQIVQETNTNDKTPQAIIDNNLSPSRSLLRDPLRRSRSLHTKPITKKLLKDCREVARDVSPQLAMWLERLEANNSKEEFERALQRNARLQFQPLVCRAGGRRARVGARSRTKGPPHFDGTAHHSAPCRRHPLVGPFQTTLLFA